MITPMEVQRNGSTPNSFQITTKFKSIKKGTKSINILSNFLKKFPMTLDCTETLSNPSRNSLKKKLVY